MSTSSEGGYGWTLRFARIHIIQSLKSLDHKTGLHLLRSLEKQPGTDGHLHYTEATTKVDFFRALDVAYVDLQAGLTPLLHIETHGSEKGLELASGQRVGWSEVKDALVRINVASRLNLFVVASACFGENVVSIAEPSSRAPFSGCIGPEREIDGGALYDAWVTFYRHLLAKKDLRVALDAIGAVYPGGRERSGTCPEIGFWTAEIFFRVLYRRYLREMCIGPGLNDRAKGLVARWDRARAEPGVRRPTVDEMARFIEANTPSLFEQHRAEFFMFDLYPECRERFSASFDSIARGLGFGDCRSAEPPQGFPTD